MTPFNFTTMSAYQGRNAADLSGPDLPAYATFNQVASLGGHIKKGAKSIPIFCGYRAKEDKGKSVTVPTWGRVFHIDDCELDPAFITHVKQEIKKRKDAA